MMLLNVTGMIAMVVCAGGAARAAVYRSPLALAVSHDGKTLYVSDKTAGCIVVLDVAAGKIRDKHDGEGFYTRLTELE